MFRTYRWKEGPAGDRSFQKPERVDLDFMRQITFFAHSSEYLLRVEANSAMHFHRSVCNVTQTGAYFGDA